MRVAALYDIHGNLPALEAVLQELRHSNVDQVVVGGDVVPGPMPRETLNLLGALDWPVHFILGNGELAMLAQMAATHPDEVTYWGTTSGAPLPEEWRPIYRWTAQQLKPDYESVLANWPKTVQLEIDGAGSTLFCHATPRNEVEIFTRLTSKEKLVPIFEQLGVAVVVCGHTHMQFDRMFGATRVVNAGSVGQPFGDPGAYWALLGPDVELRHTPYDLMKAAERIRHTEYPKAEEFAARDVQNPPSEEEMLKLFGTAELK